jgi:hypothetical protein
MTTAVVRRRGFAHLPPWNESRAVYLQRARRTAESSGNGHRPCPWFGPTNEISGTVRSSQEDFRNCHVLGAGSAAVNVHRRHGPAGEVPLRGAEKPLPGPKVHAGPSPLRKTTPSGGSTRRKECSLPWLGTGSVSTPPRFPWPLPPYCSASLLRSSFQKPARGTPNR